jgi:hypothetical protein
MLSDLGASWSYAKVDSSRHADIERIEVRAFGILLQVCGPGAAVA